jgi:hypothetical protein
VGALVNTSQILRVAGDGFLLEVAHDAMRGPGGDQIKQEEEVKKYAAPPE